MSGGWGLALLLACVTTLLLLGAPASTSCPPQEACKSRVSCRPSWLFALGASHDGFAVLVCGSPLARASGQGYVGIFDATNTTRARRQQVMKHCMSAGNFQVVFIESICTDPGEPTPQSPDPASRTHIRGCVTQPFSDLYYCPVCLSMLAILDKNYRMKLDNDDYKGMDPAAALVDFIARVAKYESVYEPIDEDDLSYIKLYNVGQKVCVWVGYSNFPPSMASWQGAPSHVHLQLLVACRRREWSDHH